MYCTLLFFASQPCRGLEIVDTLFFWSMCHHIIIIFKINFQPSLIKLHKNKQQNKHRGIHGQGYSYQRPPCGAVEGELHVAQAVSVPPLCAGAVAGKQSSVCERRAQAPGTWTRTSRGKECMCHSSARAHTHTHTHTQSKLVYHIRTTLGAAA